MSVSVIVLYMEERTHLHNPACNLRYGDPALPERVKYHAERRDEAPEDADDDPGGQAADAEDGACAEEGERYKEEKHDRLQTKRSDIGTWL